MGEKSIIAWTENTFNPWMGCVEVSPGCDHCYARELVQNRMHLSLWGRLGPRQRTSASYWRKAYQWNAEAQRRRASMLVFCGSLCDWAEDHPALDEIRVDLWNLIRATPYLTWQLLTKRAGRIAPRLPADWGQGYPNVWLGTSIESNEYAWRADALRDIPAVVRFISYEPALGGIDRVDLRGIDWLIYGGESGRGFRDHELQWARDARDRCARDGRAFFYKQSAAIRTEMGTQLDGVTIRQYPTPRRIA